MVKLKGKSKIGKVISTKMALTVTVAVSWKSRHIRYGKPVGKLSKFKAHDANGVCSLGDVVKIIESRPISKTKRWLVGEILESRGHSVIDKGFVDEQTDSDKVVSPDFAVDEGSNTETDQNNSEASQEIVVSQDGQNEGKPEIDKESDETSELDQTSVESAIVPNQESIEDFQEKDEG